MQNDVLRVATTQRSDTNRCRLLENFLASLFPHHHLTSFVRVQSTTVIPVGILYYTYYCTGGTGMGFTILVIVIIIIIITRTYTTMRLNGDDDGYQPNGFWPWMFIIGLGHRFITCITNEPGPNVLHKRTQLQYLHGVCVGVHRLPANPSARKTTSEKCKCNWYSGMRV